MQLTYQQARMIAEQRNAYQAEQDSIVNIGGREFLAFARYTVEGKIKRFFEPVYREHGKVNV